MSHRNPETTESMEKKKAPDIIEQKDTQNITNPIQNTIKRIPTNPQLQTFRTADGPFGWFAHGVTGDELNQFVNSIQKHLIESHDNNIELRGICEQLVSDLGQFDEKYLHATINSVKASEQACLEAREAQKKLESLSERINQNVDQLQNKVDSIASENNTLRKQTKTACWIAGCSGIIAFISIVLHIVQFI